MQTFLSSICYKGKCQGHIKRSSAFSAVFVRNDWGICGPIGPSFADYLDYLSLSSALAPMLTQPSTHAQIPSPNSPRQKQVNPVHFENSHFSQGQTSRNQNGQGLNLSFEELSVFDRVLDQYRGLGVQFEAAIAISPSNPAFSRHTGTIGLMSTRSQAEIVAHFRQPIRQIEASVCCTSSVMMAAYSDNDEVLEQINTEVPKLIPQAGDLLDALPLQSLALTRHSVRKVIFYSDAPFILDMLYFEF